MKPEISRFRGASVIEGRNGSMLISFDGRRPRKGLWDADLYIDSLDLLGLDSYIIRDGANFLMIGLSVSSDMDPDGSLRAAYCDAYLRRGRVFDVLPGETLDMTVERLKRDRQHVKYKIN